MIDDAALRELRGGLEPSNPGARGLANLTLNPSCQRLRVQTGAGILNSVARDVLRLPPSEQSIFALSRGERFERRLYLPDGGRIIKLYREQRAWSVDECRVRSIPDVALMPGGNSSAAKAARRAAQARRIAATESAIRAKLAGDPQAPNIVIQPVVTVPLVGVEYPIVPDLLVASNSDRMYRAAEVKSYPNRGSKTDPADVTQAALQAAVGAVALRMFMRRMARSLDTVPTSADLIFATPGGFTPTLTTQNVRSEIEIIERAFEGTPRTLEEFAATLPAGATLADPDTIAVIPANYNDRCKQFCPLAPYCRAEAQASASPSLLGTDVAEAFAGIADLERAAAIVFDGASPTPEESPAAVRLVTEWQRIQRARRA